MLIPTLLTLLTAAPAHGEARPNVLVVVGDDISESDMDTLETPTFDALAKRGLRFRRAYANPTCSPSRWSIHFGQYHTKGAGPVCDGYRPKEAPSPSQASLPRLFSEAGYRTGLFGKWHLGSHAGTQKGEPWEITPQLYGYDTWRAGLPVNANVCGGKNYWSWLRVDDGESVLSTEYIPDAIRAAFLGWHTEVAADASPWFAMVCFQSPHAPLHEAPGASSGAAELSKRQMFESQVGYLDKTLGELLEAIDLENTLVVFVADNGSPIGAARTDQDQHKMKMSTYEDGIRVPMVWAGPGIPGAAETSSLVHLVDLLPTLAEMVGGELATEQLDGVSLVPLFEAPERAVREYVWSGLGPNRTSILGEFALVTTRYKLRNLGRQPQLFDLEVDPEESVNLAGREPYAELQADLQAKLERHQGPEHQVQIAPIRKRTAR